MRHTKRRFLHQWIGFFTLIGLSLLSVSGWLLNHPDVFKSNAIQDSAIVSQQIYLLYHNSLHTLENGRELPIATPHPITSGDRLVANDDLIGVLHRDGSFYIRQDGLWERKILPLGWPERVSLGNKKWIIATTTGIWDSTDQGTEWRQVKGPYAESLHSKIRRMHSGHYWGKLGAAWINATAILTLGLIFTGLLLLRFRKRIRNST